MIANNNIPLLLLQGCCLTVTLVLALVMLMSRFHMRSTSRGYETSRWLLTSALMLYVIHYLLQMIFGFRASGEDVGALVNILFYLPIAFLMTCATLRISAGHRYLRHFVIVGVTGTVLTLALFPVGLLVYGSLHMPWVLRAMEVIYVAMIAFFIFNPGGELRRMNRKIEDETADDNTRYHIYMHSSTVLLYAMGLIGALSIFSTIAVVAVAAFFLLALIFYVVSFVSLGFHVQAVSSIIDNEDENESQDKGVNSKTDSSEKGKDSKDSLPQAPSSASASAPRLTPKLMSQIEESITLWRTKQGYSVSNLTCTTMAQRLGITKQQLSLYLMQKEGSTFRVWLSNIRIEEAKNMLLTNSDYSIEAIAEACGFSSRSWMQEKFKTSTGMTPAEWREAQKA